MVNIVFNASRLLLMLVLLVSSVGITRAQENTIPVKVFIGAMFEIGANSGDKAGEFQHWYERYWRNAQPIKVRGASGPVWCNQDGVCGAVLGMGKVRSSSSLQAILLSDRFDFSKAYFMLTGVAGAPPTKATIGSVIWADWLVDYDLGHRWAADEGRPGAPTFMPRKGYEDIRVIKLNPQLVGWAMVLTKDTPLLDSAAAKSYRARYPQAIARGGPFVGVGTHFTGDCFFHGPGLSAQAQYMAKLYNVDDYTVTEMEGVALAYVIRQLYGIDRVMALRTVVNFDQGSPGETTLEHLDPAPGKTAGGFAESVENEARVGERVVDYIVTHWNEWKNGIPARQS